MDTENLHSFKNNPVVVDMTWDSGSDDLDAGEYNWSQVYGVQFPSQLAGRVGSVTQGIGKIIVVNVLCRTYKSAYDRSNVEIRRQIRLVLDREVKVEKGARIVIPSSIGHMIGALRYSAAMTTAQRYFRASNGTASASQRDEHVSSSRVAESLSSYSHLSRSPQGSLF